jgi:hypothetical protein
MNLTAQSPSGAIGSKSGWSAVTASPLTRRARAMQKQSARGRYCAAFTLPTSCQKAVSITSFDWTPASTRRVIALSASASPPTRWIL